MAKQNSTQKLQSVQLTLTDELASKISDYTSLISGIIEATKMQHVQMSDIRVLLQELHADVNSSKFTVSLLSQTLDKPAIPAKTTLKAVS